jgi:hypothetical protein
LEIVKILDVYALILYIKISKINLLSLFAMTPRLASVLHPDKREDAASTVASQGRKSMAQKTFHITEEDIQQGRREHCTLCPVARAISREVGRTVYVCGINGLSTGRVEYLTGDGMRVAKDLPSKVGEKILCYDATGVMEPFLFAMKV